MNNNKLKIIIIKLSALGDVLRTTALLHGLKRRFPESNITWVSSSNAIDLLKNNQYIDRSLEYKQDIIDQLKEDTFDILICLDKEKGPTGMAIELKAGTKIGYGMDRGGKIYPLNKESEYAYKLGVSHELKFRINKKTYQEIIYEMCSLDYSHDRYIFNLEEKEIACAADRLKALGIKKEDYIIMINTGAGNRFANKSWTLKNYKRLIKLLLYKTHAKILLLGGKNEVALNRHIELLFRERVYDVGSNNTLREFASIIKHCNILISGDTLAMHLCIALDRYVIALFGSTCDQEIELYDKGAKFVSDIECRPCYKKTCKKKDNCMSRISPETIFEEIKRVMKNGKAY